MEALFLDPTALTPVASISGTIKSLLNEAKNVILLIIGVFVIWMAFKTYARSSSWAQTIGAIVLGALVLWGANSGINLIAEQTNEEIDSHISAPLHLDAPAGDSSV